MFPPSYQDVNRIVTEKYLNYDSGFFIEVGGADGYTQSNTWYLEKYKNWKGVLVEPNPDSAEQCRNNRPNSSVFNYALVDKDYKDSEIKMLRRVVYQGDPGLMTAVNDSPLRNNSEWMQPATSMDKTEEFTICTATLDEVLESLEVTNVDFFSLDVEGYEVQVLKGLTLEKYLPKVMLIEWHDDIQTILDVVSNTHKMTEQLSKHDYVFTLR
jgi:FkbM family methyltransferase